MAAAVRESVSDRALERFRDALGADGVVSDRDALREFRDPYAYPSWEEHTASAMVMPRSVEQVQAVVRIAGECGVSLWTFSQGRNYGYGGPAPRVGGSVLVNLRGMDRILEINEELAYALVEPGVRFFDLYEAVRERGSGLWISNPDLGWGSVIGNTLDHGFGYTSLGDHPQRQCGMEVVLADGDVLRTGMGGVSGSRAWQTAKRGFGPSLDSLFMQSNFGIVTKMGVWLMPAPEHYMSCSVHVQREDDLAPLIDITRGLLMERLIDNPPSIGSAFIVAGAMPGAPPRAHWWPDPGPVPSEVIRRIAMEMEIGWWNMRFALYGPRHIIEAKERIVRQAFAQIDGAQMTTVACAGDEVVSVADMNAQVQAGIPGMDLLRMLDWHNPENGGHVDFSPVLPMIGGEVIRVTKRLRDVADRHGFDHDPAFILTARSLVQINQTYFDSHDEARQLAAFTVVREQIAAAAELGYSAYRSHVRFMDDVAEIYDWENHASRRFNDKLKDAIDPGGVLSPGKQGIWGTQGRARSTTTLTGSA